MDHKQDIAEAIDTLEETTTADELKDIAESLLKTAEKKHENFKGGI